MKELLIGLNRMSEVGNIAMTRLNKLWKDTLLGGREGQELLVVGDYNIYLVYNTRGRDHAGRQKINIQVPRVGTLPPSPLYPFFFFFFFST